MRSIAAHSIVTYSIAALLALTAVPTADAQSLGDRLKKRAEEAAKRKVEQRVDRRAGEAADAALDKAENSVKCAASDTKCIDKAKQDGKQVVTDDAASSASASSADVSSGTAAAKATAKVGKDFTPGTRVIFATDFSRDEVGDFPRAFELLSGNYEVADIGGTRYLRATSFGKFDIPLPEVLPEMFTVEFTMKPVSGWGQHLYFTEEEQEKAYAVFFAGSGGIEGPKSYRVQSDYQTSEDDAIVPVQIMVDGKYVKVYINGTRVANAPNADIGRSNKLRFNVSASADEGHQFLIGNIRIAAGGKDLYKSLEESGRVTAEGIFFDTGSDRIRPESEPALEQIGEMMRAHPEVKILIEGHTDNVGAAAANTTLSDKRAAAVKAYLMSKHGVSADRLTSKGFGSTRPVAANDDEAGRQKNRRVELVKQ